MNRSENAVAKLVRQAEQHRFALSRLDRYRPTVAAAVIGFILSLIAAYAVSRWESQAREVELSTRANGQTVILQNGVNEYLQRLMALRTYFESVDEEMTRAKFEGFAAGLFQRRAGKLRIAWLPRVKGSERARLEKRAATDGIPDYRIRSIAADRTLTRAPEAEEYFPVFYSTEPKSSALYGLNYASDEIMRATLERARDNDLAAISPKLPAYGLDDGANSVLVAVPVYAKGTSHDSVVDRRRNISGFIVGILDIPRLLDTILSTPSAAPGIDLDVHIPGQKAQSIYRFQSDGATTRLSEIPPGTVPSQPYWTGTLNVADAIWELSASPAAAGGFAANYHWVALVLAAGIALTAALVTYVHFASHHSRQLALANRRVRELAQIDALTRLANRSHFMEKIEDARRVLAEEGTPFSIFMLDLDRFKEVNDMLGHAAGDALLQIITRRLEAATSKFDVLARLGGDEFAIMQTAPEIDLDRGGSQQLQRERAQLLAIRILEALSEPVEIEGQAIFVSSSIGIALAPNDEVDARELLKKADLALYQSKSKGRNGFSFFDPEMAAAAAERHSLKAELRLALERGEFELAYQPFVDAETRRVVGAEALLRWRNPVHGLVLPGRFIPIAEESGLIIPIGEWVLHQACRDATRWPEHVKVAVNLSAIQFRKGNLLDVVLCALVDSGLSPERLEVEVTETVLLEREMDHVTLLHQLKNIGVSVALDDFGIGYSSLGYLKQFPFDKIKIDRSFTKDVAERADSAAIVSSVTSLGRSLGILTIAEGVETDEQFGITRAAGVTLAQGYLFGRPRPACELDFTDPAARQGRPADRAGQAA